MTVGSASPNMNAKLDIATPRVLEIFVYPSFQGNAAAVSGGKDAEEGLLCMSRI